TCYININQSMKKRTLILLLIAINVWAQQKPKEAYRLSLDQAIAHALEHNYTAINSQRDIDKAQKRKWETTASGLPQINGGIDYTYNIEIPLNPIPARFFDPEAPE